MNRFLITSLLLFTALTARSETIGVTPIDAFQGVYQARIANATIFAATPWRTSLSGIPSDARVANVMIRSGTHVPGSAPTTSGAITSATFTFAQYPSQNTVLSGSVAGTAVPDIQIVNPADGTFKSVSSQMTTYGYRQYPSAGRYWQLILTSGATITSQNFTIDIVFRR